MVRLSNTLVGSLNLITLLLSIFIIGSSIWLSKHYTECERPLYRPSIATGVFFLLVSLAGFVGSCYRVSCLLWVYLVVMFLIIVFMIGSTIFLFVVTNKEALSGRGFKEYRSRDYSYWLQKRVDNEKIWNSIRSCLQDGKICQVLLDNVPSTKVRDFYKRRLSSLQSGCCKPPSDCNFNYISPTNWTRTPSLSSTNPDCTAWSNDPNSLCYSCKSCKAGVLDNTKGYLKREVIININIIILGILIIVYSITCHALKNNREDNSWKQYP